MTLSISQSVITYPTIEELLATITEVSDQGTDFVLMTYNAWQMAKKVGETKKTCELTL